MERVNVLDNINDESIERMIPCFKPTMKRYATGETILSYEADVPEDIAVLFSGEAKLEIINEEGDLFLLENYEKGDVFGQLFSLPLDNFGYLVTATSEATVLYIDYDHIITPCEELCHHHSQLVSNLFMMSAQKSQELSLHISILSQNNTRQKLLTYLKHVRSMSDKKMPKGMALPKDRSFTIPRSLSNLAEYLRVDRSSMMREINAMKKDGLIDSKSRQFRILV